jgi:hypothetical protein
MGVAASETNQSERCDEWTIVASERHQKEDTLACALNYTENASDCEEKPPAADNEAERQFDVIHGRFDVPPLLSLRAQADSCVPIIRKIVQKPNVLLSVLCSNTPSIIRNEASFSGLLRKPREHVEHMDWIIHHNTIACARRVRRDDKHIPSPDTYRDQRKYRHPSIRYRESCFCVIV